MSRFSAYANVKDIRKCNEKVEHLIESLDKFSSIEDFDNLIKKIEDEIRSLEQSRDNLKKLKEEIEKKTEACENKIDKTEQEIKKTEDDIKKIEESIKKNQEQQQAQISNLASKNPAVVALATARLAALKTEEGILRGRLSSLKIKKGLLEAELARLKSALKLLKDNLKQVEDRSKEIEKSVEEFNNHINKLNTLIDDIKNSTNEIESVCQNASNVLQQAADTLEQYVGEAIEEYDPVAEKKFHKEIVGSFNASDEYKIIGLNLDEGKMLEDKTGYSSKIITSVRTVDEIFLYKEYNLIESLVGDKSCLKQPVLEFDVPYPYTYRDVTKYMTNLERMKKGQAPVTPTGEKIELHHIGQDPNSPLAELTTFQHRRGENNKILHTSNKVQSAIDRHEFDIRIKKPYWRQRAREYEMSLKRESL